MEVTVERTASSRARISFSVAPEEFEREVQGLLRQIGQRTRLKGFRAGKAPPSLIERTHGQAVREEAKLRFLERAYQQAVDEHHLRPLAHPRVQPAEIPVVAGAPLRHDFEVELRPEFELHDYKGLRYETQLAPISDQEVEAAIARALQQNARLEPAGEEGLPENGMAMCRVVLTAGDEVVFEREGLRLGPKVPLPGVDPAAYEQALTGARDGEERELPITFPADFEKQSVRGQEGRCRVSVLQAFKVVVPSREELIATLEGVSDEEGLMAKARESLEQARLAEERRQQESELLNKVIEAHEIELPPQMVEEQVAARLEALRKELAAQGLAPDAVEEEVSNQTEELRRTASRGAKAYFLIEAIAEKEGLKVSGKELEDEFRTIAERNQAQVAEVKAYYQEQQLVPQLALEIVERKVRSFLWEQAVPAAP
jgi:trigger factor